MEEIRHFLYDDKENAEIRFVSFMGDSKRYDLAIITTNKYYGKKVVLNLLGNRFAILGPDDLEDHHYLAHAYNLTEIEADELRDFLIEVV
ncbi:hypothetical protein HNQ94_001893 [Salirhabdus euzebyi]|uniref:DUF3055 domain-containing protein n=1 Tax=Salirhabdus euzebyi TaxID=394506 RepID=A0A841Q4X5_9BACI|nr:DUF3055 domain-containing protein [Salirhabdus euzebyi]MBB6453444.1 hypothetical protein [Salirhabdus euzebyi]